MKLKKLLPLLLVLLCTYSQAQIHRDSLLFRGAILERDSLFSLSYAKYIVNNKFGYTANEDGQFSFWAKPGDIVQFSYVGFKPLYVQLNDSLAKTNYLMGIFLSRDTIQLSEVIIIPQMLNPNVIARNMPMLSSKDELMARNNIAISSYQAQTQAVTTWDAEMNQKNFIQARSNDIAYQTQVQPNRILGVSNTSISKQMQRSRLKKIKKPSRSYITQAEWEELLQNYQQRQKDKFKAN